MIDNPAGCQRNKIPRFWRHPKSLRGGDLTSWGCSPPSPSRLVSSFENAAARLIKSYLVTNRHDVWEHVSPRLLDVNQNKVLGRRVSKSAALDSETEWNRCATAEEENTFVSAAEADKAVVVAPPHPYLSFILINFELSRWLHLNCNQQQRPNKKEMQKKKKSLLWTWSKSWLSVLTVEHKEYF